MCRLTTIQHGAFWRGGGVQATEAILPSAWPGCCPAHCALSLQRPELGAMQPVMLSKTPRALSEGGGCRPLC